MRGSPLGNLVAKIRLILSQVQYPARVYTYRSQPLALADALADIRDGLRDLPVQVSRSEEVELANEQVTLLKTLYGQQPSALKGAFVTALLSHMTERNAAVVVATLVESGRFTGLLKSMGAGTPANGVALRVGVWKGIREVLSRHSHGFTDGDLTELENVQRKDSEWFSLQEKAARAYQRTGPATPFVPSLGVGERQLAQELARVHQTIDRVRYLRLQKELLEGTNPEINTDKQVLVSRMEELGFRGDIVTSLEALDTKIYEAGKPLDFKSCLDLARAIYEKIVEDAAQRTAAVKKQPVLSYPKQPFQPWKQFLVTKGILTPDEGELFQKLYGYLSSAGVHALGSAPEQVRVAKNMVIECGLLLVGRVQMLK